MSTDSGLLSRLAEQVRTRGASAVELTAEALRRIDSINPVINAVVAVRADEALAEAAEIDVAVRRGEDVGPLAGIPLLVKDLEDVRGMRTTMGTVLRADAAPADRDSLVPAKLRAAGAIVVGKTNLPEFAIESHADNPLFGTTLNPWNLEMTPGGSSGGSAAALAAGLAPIATATDGGGSIRIPASLTGLVGLKPSHNVIGREVAPDWIDLSTYGPMAATIADVRLLLSIEAGPVAGDPDVLQGPLGPWPIRPRRLLAADRTSPMGPLPAETKALFDAAVADAAGLLGLDVEWMRPQDFFDVGDADQDWFTICAVEHVAALGRDWVVAGLDSMHPATQEFFEVGLHASIDDYLMVRRRRFDYVRRMDELIGADTILLTPTVAAAGLYADGRMALDDPVGLTPAEALSTVVQNITGHPALTVPAGQFANGIPFGLQLTGPRYADLLLLDLGAQWEAARPWPRVAPGYTEFGL